MKLVNNPFHRPLAIIIAAISLMAGCITLSASLIEPQAHIAPDYPKIDIREMLSKELLSKSDYDCLFLQTGLARSAIDELRVNHPDSTQRILGFQGNFFSDIQYVCEKNSPISSEESVVDINGRYINGTQFASLHNGDILITKASHTYGWRNGHAALVVDAEKGLTLESVVLGTDSCVQDIGKWTNYPNFIQLRLRNSSEDLMNRITQSAVIHLKNIPYDLTIGILSPKFKNSEQIRKTHCSHLVWTAFRNFCYDLDSDGGGLVTPKDIANSPYLEVVQVFGVYPEEIWP